MRKIVGTVVPTQICQNLRLTTMKNIKYVLIACEESQTVCSAFREVGAEAYSLDLQECSGGHPEWHIRDFAERYLQGRRYFKTQDGTIHHVTQWDLIIAHPPCTYLSKASGIDIFKNELRRAHGLVAVEFFQQCLDAKCDRVAVENPTPLKYWNLPKPTQVIQPYEFGANYQKRTLLWLRGLPPLLPTLWATGRKSWVYSSRKAKKRSKTFPGIAKAMAEQWFPLL